MSKIIGQCNTADFKDIEYLAVTLINPEMLDVSTLSRKQKLALVVIAAFKEAGIKFYECRKIREILFWDDGHIAFKFLHVPGAKELLIRLNEPRVKRDIARGIENILTVDSRQ